MGPNKPNFHDLIIGYLTSPVDDAVTGIKNADNFGISSEIPIYNHNHTSFTYGGYTDIYYLLKNHDIDNGAPKTYIPGQLDEILQLSLIHI